MYPTGIEGKPDRVLIGLQAVGTPPPEAIDFQLWIQNHTNTDKSAVGGKYAVPCQLSICW